VTLDSTRFKRFILTHQIFFSNYEMMLELLAWMVFGQALTWCYHCFGAEKVSSLLTLYLLIPILATMMYSVRVPLQIIYLTGWRAAETKVAFALGITCFALSLFVLRLGLDPLRLGLPLLVLDASNHLQVLWLVLSRTPSVLSLTTATAVVHIGLSGLLGSLAAGMALPALRFSQTLLSILVSPRSSAIAKAIAIIEHFWPLVVAATLYGRAGGVSHSEELPGIWVAAAYVGIRLIHTRMHLQSFLDTVTRSVALVPESVVVTADPQLTSKIEARSNYLVAAAAQALALPIFFMAALLLAVRYSPTHGCDLCASLYSLTGQSAATSSSAAAAAFQRLVESNASTSLDATALTAKLAAQEPFWSDVWSVMVHSHPRGASITLDFFFKLGTLFPMPPHVIRGLSLSAMALAAVMWFTFSSLATAYWYLAPELTGLKIALQTQHPPKPIPGGSQADREREAAALAAASAAGGRKEGESRAKVE